MSPDVSVGATFNERMNPASINGTSVKLRNSSNSLVPATVSYSPELQKITLDPESPLQLSTTYTVTIKGGAGGVTDLAGNPLAGDETWSFTTVAPPPPPPDEGPGGPILVISNSANAFSRYYTEILRAEGLNEFTATDITNVTPAVLNARDVVILGEGPLTAAQANMLSEWVQQGGNLIAMRPDSDLAGLLGLTPAGGSLGNGYIQVNTGTSPGAGIVGQTIQFHGTADRYTTAGAQTIATLFSDATTSTPNPAVTLRSVGSNGGQAAAFTYDLARSVVYTRQGNPAWAGQERDGVGPIRSDDLFFGAKAGDVQPDWVNLSKVAIPQADEQQRLLTNLIEKMNLDRQPLPRFWFLPRDKKAAVVMTGDDHSHNGTEGRLNHYKTLDPPGCVVANWECVRSTSYIYPDTPITDAKAAQLVADGFEIALHSWTNCEDWESQTELETYYSGELEEFAANYPSVPTPTTNRTHCIVWSDWATQPKVELKDGIRLDTNYYYWPPEWIQNRPGMFTGSGMPMRFADLDGSMIDVYQAATQMTDESGQTYPFTVNELLDHAIGPEGYYGVFTANIHNDSVTSTAADAIVASAQSRGVPVVSARQMLTWLDGRNNSSFGSVKWNNPNKLEFTIDPASGASGLRAMVPTVSGIGSLIAVERNGQPVTTTTRTIKGLGYAFFDAAAGSYTARYRDETAPAISNVQATAKNDGTATVTWETNEPANSRVDYGTAPGSLTQSQSSGALVTAHSVQVSGLAPNTTYYFRVTSSDGEGNTATTPDPLLSPQTFQTPPPAPVLTTTIPASPANATSPKVVGSAVAGSTVRIYAGADCSGTAIATTSAVALEAGIEVTVADNSTSSFRATASNAAGLSGCSEPLTYVEDSTAPNTSIGSNLPALSNSANASFSFSGTDAGGSGVASFECRRDGAAFAACTSPQAYSGLADGSHTFEVRAIDTAGNVDADSGELRPGPSTPPRRTPRSARAHRRSPTAPTRASASPAPTPAAPALRASNAVATAPPSPPAPARRPTPGSPDGSHTFEVRAIDTAGNVDQTPASFAWTVDTTAPTTSDRLEPTGAHQQRQRELLFLRNRRRRLRRCELRMPSRRRRLRRLHQPAGLLRSRRRLPHLRSPGRPTTAGNVDQTPASFAWTIDTTAPNTSIGSSPPALSNSANASFSFSGTDVGGSGVASFECRRDGAAFAACTSPQAYSGLARRLPYLRSAGGRHGREHRRHSGAPRPGPSTPPRRTPRSAPVHRRSPTAPTRASASPEPTPAARALRASNAVATAPPSPPAPARRPTRGLADGSHTFEVRATDTAGNVDQTPASFAWTVDTTAPTTSIGSSPPALSNSANASFSFSGHRCRRLRRCELRMPSRRRRLRRLHQPAGLLGSARRLPYLRSPRGRHGRQRRPDSCELHLDDRHHRAQHLDRLEPARTEQQRQRELLFLRNRCRRLRRCEL